MLTTIKIEMTTAVTIAMMKINNCNLKGNRD